VNREPSSPLHSSACLVHYRDAHCFLLSPLLISQSRDQHISLKMTFIKLSQAQRLYVIIGISCSFFIAEISVGFYTFVSSPDFVNAVVLVVDET